MVWFLGVLVVLVIGAAVVVALGRGGGLRPVYDDRPDALVAAGAPLTGEAVRSVRFSVGLRGYRMDEVDALLARLADQLDDQPHDQPHDRPDNQPHDQRGDQSRGQHDGHSDAEEHR